jgi:Uma2 family endonuclease
MSARQSPFITPEAYLAAERASDTRSEYVNGEVFAMFGGSRNHSYLIANFARELGNTLDDRPCNVSVSDLRLQVAPEGAYLYPDVMVVCEDDASGIRDMITNPTLVVEVLSPSSERWNRVGKFAQYRRVNGLREYVLVSQDEMRVEWFTRHDDGDWIYREANGPNGICQLEHLGIEIPLDSLYRKITFPEL